MTTEVMTPIMTRGPMGLAKEGYPFLGVGLILSAVGWWIFWPLGLAFTLAFFFCVNFFRDPARTPPADEQLLVSPADGKVLKIERLEQSPIYPEAHQKISIFMSALDVHVNRIPCDGTVVETSYHPGKFFVASLDKASLHNERNTVILKTPQQQTVAFTQIAGLVARRIVCYLKGGENMRRGERYGMIRFGSRMEISLPKEWSVLVKSGEKVAAGETALARMK